MDDPLAQLIQDPLKFVSEFFTWNNLSKLLIAFAAGLGVYIVGGGTTIGGRYTSWLGIIALALSVLATVLRFVGKRTAPVLVLKGTSNVLVSGKGITTTAAATKMNNNTSNNPNPVKEDTGSTWYILSQIVTNTSWIATSLIVFGLLPAILFGKIGWSYGFDVMLLGIGLGFIAAAFGLVYVVMYFFNSSAGGPVITQTISGGCVK